MKSVKLSMVFAAIMLMAATTNAQDSVFKLRDSLAWMYYGSSLKFMLLNGIYCPAFSDMYWLSGTKEKNGKTYHNLYFSRSYYDCGGFLIHINVGDHYETEEDTLGLLKYPRTITSIGIREEGRRFLVDKEEYMALLEDSSYWSRVGDASYIPYEQTDDGELVLYDFNKKLREVYCKDMDGSDILLADAKNIIDKDGVRRGQFYLSNGLTIVDGIGCINSPGNFLFYLNPRPGTPIDFVRLETFYIMTKSIYIQHTIYYNDFDDLAREFLAGYKADVEELNIISETNVDEGLYLLDGRRIGMKPDKGIYIQGGKKKVAW